MTIVTLSILNACQETKDDATFSHLVYNKEALYIISSKREHLSYRHEWAYTYEAMQCKGLGSNKYFATANI